MKQSKRTAGVLPADAQASRLRGGGVSPPRQPPGRRRSAVLAIIFALLSFPALAATPPTTCGVPGDYPQALCAYQRRDFANAERLLRAIVERDAKDPQTIRSTYFLARTLMKTGRFDEAHALLIRIYSLDPAFYDTWNGDFLLGECRKALGK